MRRKKSGVPAASLTSGTSSCTCACQRKQTWQYWGIDSNVTHVRSTHTNRFSLKKIWFTWIFSFKLNSLLQSRKYTTSIRPMTWMLQSVMPFHDALYTYFHVLFWTGRWSLKNANFLFFTCDSKKNLFVSRFGHMQLKTCVLRFTRILQHSVIKQRRHIV